MKPRIAILISGGGSNMISLVKSINANKINAVAAIVISNCKDANGLKRAKDLSVPSKLIDQKKFEGNQEFFEDYRKSFNDVLDSGWFILGNNVNNFEIEFSNVLR